MLINVQPLFSNCRALAFWSRVLFLVTNPAYERFAREKAESADLDSAALRLSRLVEELQKPKMLDTVRGHEGDAARVYRL